MIPGDNSSCFPQSPPYGFHMYGIMEEILSSSSPTPAAAAAGMPSVEVQVHPNSLLYNLSVIREKVQQVEAVVGMMVNPDQMHHTSVGAIASAGAGALMQEIIATATSMMFVFQQMASTEEDQDHEKVLDGGQLQEPRPGGVDGTIGQAPFGGGSSSEHKEAYNNNNNSNSNNSKNNNQMMMTNRFFDGGKEEFPQEMSISHDNNQMIMTNARFFDGGKAEFPQEMSTSHEFPDLQHYDVIELDAADLLAKYTHYCHICGKGFKRDANLRMHMRAHGDEYKTNAALTNPMKKCSTTTTSNTTMGDYKVDHCSSQQQPQAPSRKYSCPQEGCRWNQKHAKFQPLKSMICVKNHYRRSHCPKMYVCNRCNRKQFSVLSDLRTHEKHCGDLKWRCSCGTTFSRKDKLMGHIALFVGHAPVVDVIVGAAGHKGMIR